MLLDELLMKNRQNQQIFQIHGYNLRSVDFSCHEYFRIGYRNFSRKKTQKRSIYRKLYLGLVFQSLLSFLITIHIADGFMAYI